MKQRSSWELCIGLCMSCIYLIVFLLLLSFLGIILLLRFHYSSVYLSVPKSLSLVLFCLRREVKREHVSLVLLHGLRHNSNDDRQGTGADSAEESGGPKPWFFLSHCITGGTQASACTLSVGPIQNTVLAEVG